MDLADCQVCALWTCLPTKSRHLGFEKDARLTLFELGLLPNPSILDLVIHQV